MNGLVRRLEALEGRQAVATGVGDVLREEFARRIAERADRLRGRPAPPLDQQSPFDRCILAALAEAEGTEGRECIARFWGAFSAAVRATVRERGR
jgi:hypothetical protein